MVRFIIGDAIARFNLSYGDVDVLRKAKLATLGMKSGKTTVTFDPNVVEEFIEERRKYRR